MSESAPSDPVTAPAKKPAPHVLVHRWPWYPHEYRAMVIAAVFVAVVGYFLGDAATTPWKQMAFWIGTAAMVPLSVLWLWHVGHSRKSKSAVRVEINGSRISVSSDGALGASAVDTNKVRSVSYRRFGSDECFILSAEDQNARVPVRTTADPQVRSLLEGTIARIGRDRVAEDARELFERMPEPANQS